MSKTYLQGEVLTAADLNQSFLDLKTLPINTQTATYTLVLADLGTVISATGSVNIPASVFASGGTVSIFNNSAAVINIVQASGLTLYNASTGVAGSFTLNSRGICSVIFVSPTVAVLTGVGVSVTASGTLQGPVGPAGSFATISAGSAAAPSIAPSTDTNTGMFFPAADTIAFAEGGEEAMRIDSNSRVNIGTTSSASGARLAVVGGPIQLSGSTSAAAGLRVQSISSVAHLSGINSDNNAFNPIAFYTSANEAMRISTTGNVGIGETNPTRKLEVVGTASATYFNLGADTASAPAVDAAITRPAGGTIALIANAAERLRIASAGQIGIGGANYGTSGQVLTSGGPSAAPSWATVSATGQLLRAPQILTSGTSYTTPANCTSIYVEVVGGGGAGAFQTGSNNAGGGGAGGYAAKYFTVTASTAYTYAIAAGGATRVSAGEGAAGGSTTFTVGATTITGSGGAGGTRTINVPVSGGTGTNGDINISGQSGLASHGSSPYIMGAGGSSVFGFGGTSGGSSTPFAAGTGYGSGGAGAATGATSSVGQPGLIKIWEYS
jgi:hypothetical protein